MKKLFILLLLFLFILPQVSFAAKKVQAKTRRVNPVCSSAHLNLLSSSDVDRQTNLLQQAGINWVRFDFTWFDMEPAPLVYDWSKYDYIVNSASTHNIKIIALISQYGLPTWYRQNSSDWMSPPQNPQDYATFSHALALHFKGKIQLYEIGNEPNITLFWPPQVDVASYSALLKAAYPAIKTADSNANVISAGLANVDPEPFTNGMYVNGVKGSFDYFGFHPYSWPRSPDDDSNATAFSRTALIHQIMINNGDNKQIMATEVGWPTFSGGVDEATQAAYINRVYQKIEHENYTYVPIACIYDFLDDGSDPTNPEDNFGLLRFDYSLKPSYSTMQSVRSDYNAHFIQINP